MLSRVRNLIRESSAAQWTDIDIYQYLNAAHQKLGELAGNEAGSFFVATHTFSMTADTDAYRLPTICASILKLERIDGTVPQEVLPIAQSEEWQFVSALSAGSTFSINQRYLIEGENLRIVPVPRETISNAFRLRYIRSQPFLHSGTASSVASTSITFPASPTRGDITTLDDAYNGLSVYIVSASTGAGQQRLISDYVGDTRVATVPTWSTTPTGTIVYALVPEIPLRFHDWIVYSAASDALNAVQDDASGLMAMLAAQERSIRSAITKRQQQRPRRIRVTDPW